MYILSTSYLHLLTILKVKVGTITTISSVGKVIFDILDDSYFVYHTHQFWIELLSLKFTSKSKSLESP